MKYFLLFVNEKLLGGLLSKLFVDSKINVGRQCKINCG